MARYGNNSPLADLERNRSRSFSGSNKNTSYKTIRPKPWEKTYAVVPELWQNLAWEAYEQIPEVGFTVDLTAKMVEACSLRIGIEDATGKVSIVGDSDTTADTATDAPDGKEMSVAIPYAILRSLSSPLGGQSELLMSIAQNLQITGEGFLVGVPTPVAEFDYEWEFFSSSEISVRKDSKTGRTVYSKILSGIPSAGRSKENEHTFPQDSYVIRIWRPNPRFRNLSDCALRKNLILCQEILKFTQVINAVNDSRLNAGMLLIPEEFSFGSIEDSVGESSEDDDNMDELTQDLIYLMSDPVAERDSPASLVPLIFRGKGEYLSYIKRIDLAKEFPPEYRETRQELVHRLIVGLDIPIEVVQGKSSVNHWTGHSIETEFINKHIVPLGNLIASRLTIGFLRPFLSQYSDMDYAAIQKMHVVFDPTNILTRSDRESVARRLFEVGAVSESAYVKAAGFGTDARPSDAERKQRKIMELIKTSPTTLGPILLPLLDGFEDQKEQLTQLVSETAPQRPDGSYIKVRDQRLFPAVTNEDDPRTKDGNLPPDQKNQYKDPEKMNAVVGSDVITGLLAITDQWRKRQIELAANRMISKSKKNKQLTTRFSNVQSKRDVVLLFDETEDDLGMSVDEVFSHASDVLALELHEFMESNEAFRDVDFSTQSSIVETIVSNAVPVLYSSLYLPEQKYSHGFGIDALVVESALAQ